MSALANVSFAMSAPVIVSSAISPPSIVLFNIWLVLICSIPMSALATVRSKICEVLIALEANLALAIVPSAISAFKIVESKI